MKRAAGLIAALVIACGPSSAPAPNGGGDPPPEKTALCIDLGAASLEPVDPFGSAQTASDDEILAVPAIASLYDELETGYSDPVKAPTGAWVIAAVARCNEVDCPARIGVYDPDGTQEHSAELPVGSNSSGDAADISVATYSLHGARTVWVTYVVEGTAPQFHIAVFSFPELELRFHSEVGDIITAPYESSCVPTALGTVDANCDDTPDLVLDRVCGIDACLQPDAPLECVFRDAINERTVFLWRPSSRQYVSAHQLDSPEPVARAVSSAGTDRAAAACAAARKVNASDPTCELIDASRVDGDHCEPWALAHLDSAASGPRVGDAYDCIATATDCATLGACMAAAQLTPRALTAEELARIELHTGIEACDEPHNKYIRCIAGSAPDEVIGAMLSSLAQSADTWKQAAATAEGRTNLETLCPVVAAEWQKAALAMGCAW